MGRLKQVPVICICICYSIPICNITNKCYIALFTPVRCVAQGHWHYGYMLRRGVVFAAMCCCCCSAASSSKSRHLFCYFNLLLSSKTTASLFSTATAGVAFSFTGMIGKVESIFWFTQMCVATKARPAKREPTCCVEKLSPLLLYSLLLHVAFQMH